MCSERNYGSWNLGASERIYKLSAISLGRAEAVLLFWKLGPIVIWIFLHFLRNYYGPRVASYGKSSAFIAACGGGYSWQPLSNLRRWVMRIGPTIIQWFEREGSAFLWSIPWKVKGSPAVLWIPKRKDIQNRWECTKKLRVGQFQLPDDYLITYS